jgi:hypothetical protein
VITRDEAGRWGFTVATEFSTWGVPAGEVVRNTP